MNDVDEVLEEIGSLERKVERMEKTYIEVTNELVNQIKIQSEMLTVMGEIIGLAKSPTTKDLEAYAALREAYDKYDFVRKLALGKIEAT